jgi:elongation factor P
MRSLSKGVSSDALHAEYPTILPDRKNARRLARRKGDSHVGGILKCGKKGFGSSLPPSEFALILPPFASVMPGGQTFKNLQMANTSDISRGLIIKLDGSLYTVVEFGENKTARAAAKVWAKLKGVDNSRTIEKTWNSGDTIYPVRVERKNFQFLYKDDTGYNFMDNETFEQVVVNENLVDAPQFLKEGQEVTVLFNTETELPMSVELPDKIVTKVTYSEPGVKGDTATRTLKQATIETGATVMVPLFVNEGDVIRVNTKTGDYLERVKD